MIPQTDPHLPIELASTPRDHVEALRAYWLHEARAGRSVSFVSNFGRLQRYTAVPGGKQWIGDRIYTLVEIEMLIEYALTFPAS